MKFLKDWRLAVVFCLTLGLAPYRPEPHLVGKIRWLAGGAKGMQFQDYTDLILHGFPFVWLSVLILVGLKRMISG